MLLNNIFKRKVSIILLTIFLLTILLCGCAKETTSEEESKASEEGSKASKVYEWKITGPNVDGHPRYEFLEYFANAVEKSSGGRLKIELYPAGSLYPITNALDAVKQGVTEGTVTWGDYWAGKEPMLKLLTYRPCDPFKDLNEANYLVMKSEDLVKEAYKKLGVTYVGSLIALPGEIFQSNVPIKSLEDFNGLRVRSSGLGQDVFKKLNAAIIAMPMSEVYTAMKLGTLDAFESGGMADNWRSAYQEVAKYIIEPPLHAPGPLMGGHLIVNNDAWNKLPDDLKAIVKYCAEATRLYICSQIRALDGEAKKKFIDYGAEFITLPEEDVEKAREIGAEVLLSYRDKSSLCKQFVELYHDVLLELGYTNLAKIFEN